MAAMVIGVGVSLFGVALVGPGNLQNTRRRRCALGVIGALLLAGGIVFAFYSIASLGGSIW